MAMLTANWDVLGSHFYRRVELYCMPWKNEIELSTQRVAAAAYGGPVALMRDDSALLQQMPSSKPVVYIFSSSGNLISQFRWNSGRVVDFHWSGQEELVCVQEDGSVLIYDMFGSFKKTFSFGNEVKETLVAQSRSFRTATGTGLAVLTRNGRFYVINNVNDPRVRKLAQVPGLETAPSCWTIVNQERNVQALVAVDSALYILDQGGQSELVQPPFKNQPAGAYTNIAASFTGRHLCLFTEAGVLWLGTTDMRTTYCEIQLEKSTPQQIAWCGPDSVVAQWGNELHLFDLKGQSLTYDYEGKICLVEEVDGIRIITQTLHELLQKVPYVVEQLFRIGSMEPGAMLFGAAKEFQRKSEKADLYFTEIKDQLDTAVEQCTEAAGHEYDPSHQKMLLRAASFGKCFLSDYKPEPFVDMCQTLRILNAVRDYTIGIPLTYTQLHYLTKRVLIDRLIFRRLFSLAMRICQFIKLPETDGASRVLAHWACYKVEQADVDDEVIARAIVQKLGDSPGVSYSEIASKAYSKGRTQLAIRLLEFEARSADQVPLLMKMDHQELALDKAIESGDSDLVYTVILHLKEKLPLADFLMAIRTKPVAYSLYLQFCRDQQQKLLQDLHYQEDNHLEEANCRVLEAYTEERYDARLSAISAAMESYSKAKCDWATKACEDQVKLMKQQRKMEKDAGQPYLDLSIHQNIHQLLMEKNHKLAEQMRKDFKVPERRFWWLKISALAEDGDWAELERFSKSKKSPVGYEPFVDVCLKHQNVKEAQKYLSKVLPENKVKWHVKTGQLDAAADIAFSQRNVDELNYILNRCTSSQPGLSEKILSMKNQIGGKR